MCDVEQLRIILLVKISNCELPYNTEGIKRSENDCPMINCFYKESLYMIFAVVQEQCCFTCVFLLLLCCFKFCQAFFKKAVFLFHNSQLILSIFRVLFNALHLTNNQPYQCLVIFLFLVDPIYSYIQFSFRHKGRRRQSLDRHKWTSYFTS